LSGLLCQIHGFEINGGPWDLAMQADRQARTKPNLRSYLALTY